MLRAILNKSWRQHPTRRQLYGHLPPITKTIQVRRARHAGHCWRSKDELVSDVLLWTPTYDQAKAGQPAQTYMQQLCEDTGCNPEDLPEAMNDREKWRDMVKDIRAGGTTWWWWWYRYENNPYMAKSESILVSPNGCLGPHGSVQSWSTIWWDQGRLALGHVGIIFTILALSHVLSTLSCFSLGNSVSVFFPFD